MKKLTLISSILLATIACFGYFGADLLNLTKSKTSLIPLAPAIGMFIGWFIALKNIKAGIHIAVIFSLLGTLAGFSKYIKNIIKQTASFTTHPANYFIVAMAIICLIHLIFSIRSFIRARKK